MAFDTHYRLKDCEISRKYGETLIATLRNSYGSGFAQGCADDDKLSDVSRNWITNLYLNWFATINLEYFL